MHLLDLRRTIVTGREDALRRRYVESRSDIRWKGKRSKPRRDTRRVGA